MAKKKKVLKLSILIIIMAFFVGGYFYLNYYFNSSFERDSKNLNLLPDSTKLPLNKKLKESVVSDLQKLKQYGNWPIGTVETSPARGNPFQEKILEEEVK
ncbi:MAG: hypothetical protein WCV92_04505 [Candidatus Buchananbacteria bacterium]